MLHRVKIEKIDTIVAFAQNNADCKQRALLAYFGEQQKVNCGNCSAVSCDEKVEINLHELQRKILDLLQENPLSAHELNLSLAVEESQQLGLLLDTLEANGKIKKNTFDQFYVA